MKKKYFLVDDRSGLIIMDITGYEIPSIASETNIIAYLWRFHKKRVWKIFAEISTEYALARVRSRFNHHLDENKKQFIKDGFKGHILEFLDHG